MGGTELVEFLRTWTTGCEAVLRDEGIAISLVLPHDPSAVAVAILYAERQTPDLSPESATTSGAADLMGQLALAADGLCVVELLEIETGETLYKSAVTATDETQLTACLTDFLARLRS